MPRSTVCGRARTPTRSLPGLRGPCLNFELDLPATAIGKDYLGSSIIGTAPSGSGFQLSLGGLLGITVSGVEGFEINMMGLNFGIGPGGVKLPIVGLIGGRTEPKPSTETVPPETSEPSITL